MKQTYEEQMNELRIAAQPIREQIGRLLAPIVSKMNDAVLFCCLYQAKRRQKR